MVIPILIKRNHYSNSSTSNHRLLLIYNESRWPYDNPVYPKNYVHGPRYVMFWWFGTYSYNLILLDSKVHGANMGPTWVLSAPGGPHVSPTNLATRVLNWHRGNHTITDPVQVSIFDGCDFINYKGR